MTRINCIPPSELVDKHLLAEYRELPRVFALARPQKPGEVFPAEYTLGAGHVRFFYDKLTYLHSRYGLLVEEMGRRGFVVNYPLPPKNYDLTLYGNWTPDDKALSINRARIAQRLREMEARHGEAA